MKRHRRARSSAELARSVPSAVAVDARTRTGAGPHGGSKRARARRARREARGAIQRGEY